MQIYFITARVRREGNVFTGVSLSVHKGVPQSLVCSQVLSGGYPKSQVLSQVLVPGPFWGEWWVPQSQALSLVSGPRSFPILAVRVLQSQLRGTPGQGYPNQEWGTPEPGQGWVPHLHWDWATPPPPPTTEQQSEYLLSGGRYSSCGHAGGLSCSFGLHA